jgi:peptidoglycan/LPS O-acetylase OafA/YrhL
VTIAESLRRPIGMHTGSDCGVPAGSSLRTGQNRVVRITSTGEGAGGGGFRSDLEGLRGVAVGLVVLYHAGLLHLSGGFVGVDVFYVLSGFFITGILLREHAATGRISLAGFYARRMRRLLPAAGLTIAVTVLASYLILPPLRFAVVGRDAIAAALYVSNIRFAQFATDYLNAGGAPSPLLHFWSLGVEEQFYALWPLLLIGLLLLGRRRLVGVALALVFAASLACSVWLTSYSQPWAFFTLPSRAWELALGALIALAGSRLSQLAAGLRVLAGWIGLALVVGSGYALSSHTVFPGYAALMPVLGSGLVIAGGVSARAGVSALLSLRPLRALGRWSYSLYLWHWPLITLAAAHRGGTLPLWERIALVAAAVPLSALSYRFVETPFRRSPALARKPRYGLAAGVAISAAAAACGLALVLVRGPLGVGTAPPPGAVPAAQWAAATVVPANVQPALSAAQGDLPVVYTDGCHLSFAATHSPPCVFGDTSAKRTVVLFGDSHAAQWFPALDEIAQQQHWRLEVLTKSSCAATLARLPNPIGGGGYRQCSAWQDSVLKRLAGERPYLVVVSSLVPLGQSDAADRSWLDGYAAMIRALRGRAGRVVTLGDVPRPSGNVPNCLSAHIRSVRSCTMARSAAVDSVLWRDVSRDTTANGGRYLATDRWACPGAVCPVLAGDVLVYRDDTHLSIPFVDFLRPRLERALLADLR